MTLVECIPNVSEGRRTPVVEALARAFDAPGATLLHVHPDVDHNRTVYTVAGEPGAIVGALEELYARAIESIDLRRHGGAHPRIGAVDVCPFVPLRDHGTSMADCVEMAQELAGRVAARFGLPVFLYAEAAKIDDRRDLAAIRKGQFEGLGEKLANRDWKPDYGPRRPHPSAGASAIGARGPLIAFNVILESNDIGAARAIAARVRASSGGLAKIKAMGVVLGSRRLVQVSMNVEDPSVTPLHIAYETVRAEAAARRLAVLETELVGLAPLAVVAEAAAAGLQINGPPGGRVLEHAIARSVAS